MILESVDIHGSVIIIGKRLSVGETFTFNIRSSRYVRLAWTADWKGLASFLMATFMFLLVSREELKAKDILGIKYKFSNTCLPLQECFYIAFDDDTVVLW